MSLITPASAPFDAPVQLALSGLEHSTQGLSDQVLASENDAPVTPGEREEKLPPPSELAPMLRQYREMKSRFQEHLLLFQVGDFYEVFFEDAKTVSETLSIRLTSRDKNNPNPVPMCGVPVHAIESYLQKLIASGFSCVLISQVDDESNRKSGIRREVSRIVTPGVRFEGDGLEEKRYNYLAAVLYGPRGGAVAFVDVSTGHLRIEEVETTEDLAESLDRISPSEIVLPLAIGGVPLDRNERWVREIKKLQLAHVVYRPFGTPAGDRLRGVEKDEAADRLTVESWSAIDTLLAYVDEIACGRAPRLDRLSVGDRGRTVFIDGATRRNLELTESRIDGNPRGSLVYHIDRTKTAMGGRLLVDWILIPSASLEEVGWRHDAVGELIQASDDLSALRDLFVRVRDLDRLLSRVTSLRATPRDLAALRDSIEPLAAIGEILKRKTSARLSEMSLRFDPLDDVRDNLTRALVSEPPTRLNEGGIFRENYHEELDSLRMLRQDAHDLLAALEAKERDRTGIPSLKVRYNNIFGYFIEVSKTHLAKVPQDFERKQTLANAERFVTQELKELEVRILSAKGRQLELEKELFLQLRADAGAQAARIQATSRVLAELDVFGSFADLARLHQYVRPVLNLGKVLRISGGRHPVVEQVLGRHNFIPNDTLLDGDLRRFAVLTGPNMGGKSTYLRQVALIQLLAQCGSFVPAEAAELGFVDRIFTRIGAADDLTRGESTFMVEMKEAAIILKRATEKSLVLIDEIGRGTATADGLALATSIAEWLHGQLRARTLFATHFHELTALPERNDGAFCLTVGVVEHENGIEFTHRIVEASGGKSYGIEVARIAGLPDEVLRRARELLDDPGAGVDDQPNVRRAAGQANGLPSEEICRNSRSFIALRDRLETYDINRLSPIAALVELEKLKHLVRGGD